ncbi:MAG: hypothetical protein KDC92_17295, partial [Bacteroidetes bacterium]|nr:hypothetical protein [Bacteroidota bacterium]
EHKNMNQFLHEFFFATPNDSLFFLELLKFTQDSLVQYTYSQVQEKHADLNNLELQIEDAFKHIKYHLNIDSFPRCYTLLTHSEVQAFTYPGLLMLSIDRYFGADYAYPTPNTPNYKRVRMLPEYMIINLMKSYFNSLFPEDQNTDNTLLSRMIYEGKKLYFLDAILPKVSDTLKVEYDKSQLQWCFENEYQIYDHMVSENLLFETDHLKSDKYLHEAPHTQGVPVKSPPRLGQWFGWQIVRHYMQETGASLTELLQNKNYQDILKKAKYKP